MAPPGSAASVLDLPLEVLTSVCQQLDLRALVRVAQTCKRFCHGDGGLETAELPTKSPVFAALRELVLSEGGLVPSKRPISCSESWMAYLARCVRQRRCREAPLIAAGYQHSLFLNETGRLVACGRGAAAGHGEAARTSFLPNPVAAVAEVRVRSLAAGFYSSLALGWDGRVFSWGANTSGQLGQGDDLARPLPVLIEGLEGVRFVDAGIAHSLAVTQSGTVFMWGRALLSGAEDENDMPATLRPIIVEGFGGKQVRAGNSTAFAIGDNGEVFSWGEGAEGLLGLGDTQDQASPKRVQALRGVRMSSVSVGVWHALALAEDGLVYTWGMNEERALLGNPDVEVELLPKPVEALRGVHAGSVAAAGLRSYAVADTGEVWAWGVDGANNSPLGHDERMQCRLPKPIKALRGVKVDAVVAEPCNTLALADDRRVYAWGNADAVLSGALGLGRSVSQTRMPVHTPQCIPALRVACGL
jgi:alpha-tubulin suppressor-like RCC1 family protein